MPDTPSFGRLDASPTADEKPPGPETPFRIAIFADFSGRGNRGAAGDLAGRKPVKVTHDTLDDTVAKLAPALRLPVPDEDEPAEIAFASPDDFHPDEIHDKVSKFEDLDGDEEKTALMAALLHHPDFQALESAWRGLDWLLRRVERKSGVAVVLYDVARAELAADLTGTDDLSATALHRLLIEQGVQGSKGQPWGLLLGHYTFDATAEDAELLGRLAKLARRASAPFVAAGAGRLLEKDFEMDGEAAAAWGALRELPAAAWLGLAVPRFLLRLPYGENTKSIDRFAFEEFAGPSPRDGYLWGNPALACGCLLGLAFLKDGWRLKPGAVLDLEGMPTHVYRQDDEEEVTVGEAWLARPQVEKLVKLGLMPLLSVRGKDALQLFRFLSLARPPKGQQAAELAGRWGGAAAAKTVARAAPQVSASIGVPAPETPAAGDAPPEESPVAESPAGAEPPPGEEAMDPELAALMQQMEAAPAVEAAPEPAEEAMDPELAALMAQLESGGEEAPAAAEAPPSEPPAEEMDPELAALMAQLEGGGEVPPSDTPPPEDPTPAAEEMDPELAALMAQLGGSAEEAPPVPEPSAETNITEGEVDPALAELMSQIGWDDVPAPTADVNPVVEQMDPELAALMGGLEDGVGEVPPAPEVAPAEAPAEEMDPELAALMAGLEGGEAPPPDAPLADEPGPAEGAMDPELAALMSGLDAAESPPAEDGAAPATDLAQQVEALGGLAALEDLGWPTFARSFREDLPRQLRILQGRLPNRAVAKEVEELVAQLGGYAALVATGVMPALGLNALLARLRAVKAARDPQPPLSDTELQGRLEALGGEAAYTELVGTPPLAMRLEQLRAVMAAEE